jgi:hypothetical protein
MTQIREGVFRVTYTELGKPQARGYAPVPSGGELLLDEADLRYIAEYLDRGFEPAFFVKRTPALRGAYVVVGRHRA